MSYRYNRQEVEFDDRVAGRVLSEVLLPRSGTASAIQEEHRQRLALKTESRWRPNCCGQRLIGIESHFGYQLTLQTGVKRIDLTGKEVGTVTELEHRAAQKYVHDRKARKNASARQSKCKCSREQGCEDHCI